MAKVQGTFYTAETQRKGVTPVSPPNAVDDPVDPLNPPGSGNTTTYKQLGDTTDKTFVGKNGYVPIVENENELTLYPLFTPPDIDRISQVGTITFDSATEISADDWKAIFSGIELDTTPLTLDPVTGTPTTYSRIDSVYYKPDGTIGYVTGAENPEGTQFPPAIPDGTLRMADILRTTGGINTITYVEVVTDDFVSKSETDLQTIQSNLAIATQTGTDPNYAIFGSNGVITRGRPDQAGLYSTLQGIGGYSNILTINMNLPDQLNYYAVIEFHGVTTAYEKGWLWVQFQVDTDGDMVTNSLKCFGEFDTSLYTMVKTSSTTYDLFVEHAGANAFYKFRPLAGFGVSAVYTYYQLQAKVDPLPAGDQYGFTAYGGGGTDPNAVHYNAADGKNESEKNQARANTGSTSQVGNVISTTGGVNNVPTTNPFIIFDGAGVVNVGGLADPLDGKEVAILNLTGNTMDCGGTTASAAENRFESQTLVANGQFAFFKYKQSIQRWGSVGQAFLKKDVEETTNARFSILQRLYVGAVTSGQKSAAYNVVKAETGSAYVMDFFNFSDVLRLRIGDFIFVPTRLHLGFSTSAGTAAYNYMRPTGGTQPTLRVETSAGAVIATLEQDRTIDQGAKSTGPTRLIRRDEKRLYEVVTVTTAGAINNQALTAGIWNYRFTACTSLTGLVAFEIGDKITIQNDNTVDLVWEHENAGSIAANRNNVIGAASLNIPTKGKIEAIYCTGSRWELVSKNF